MKGLKSYFICIEKTEGLNRNVICSRSWKFIKIYHIRALKAINNWTYE